MIKGTIMPFKIPPIALLLTLAAAATQAAPLPKLTVRGERLVDARGRAVTLKGTNLGNWLMLEMWMMGLADPEKGGYRDQHEFESILAQRFGDAERERLMDLFRASWMTERDWRHIRSFGMNVVRLPINYRLLEDDERPMRLRPDAWQWIDRAVDQAERHGLYTILDLHGVQGGQSVYDHTGHSGQNRLWTSPQDQERAAWLWRQIASRYRNRSAVVAYDAYNEPYGGTKEQQVALFRKLYPAIRAVDPDKLVFAHGHYDDFTHYGDPRQNGWRNVGFQMHYYPGLFGNGNPTPLVQARHLQAMAGVEATQNRLDVPFLIGEFNVVFDQAGGPAMMRRHFDLYTGYGWIPTMWSYKALSTEGGVGSAIWGMVTSARPSQRIDLRTATKPEVEAFMRSFASMPLAVHERLRTMLTARNPVLPPLPGLPARITKAPYTETVAPWSATDIGGSLPGGLRSVVSGLDLYGGGSDIWGERDQFRFLHQPVDGDFELTATVASLDDTDQYAKAGLMLRESLDPAAPHVLLSVFPSGEVQLAQRAIAGGGTQGSPGREARFPDIRLRLVRRGDTVTASTSKDGAEWTEVGSHKVAWTGGFVGLVALSHDKDQLTRAAYRDVSLRKLP
jgi:glucan 1,3-beta-glucosidase